MESRIRPATIADLFWLRLLLGQLMESMPEAYPSPTREDLEAQTAMLASRLGAGDPSLLCYVAESDEVVNGFVLGDMLARIGRPHTYLFVSFFFVTPAVRGQGVGRALSTAVINEARVKGAEVVEFIGQAGDKQWRKRGWATVGVVHALPLDAATATLGYTKQPNGGDLVGHPVEVQG